MPKRCLPPIENEHVILRLLEKSDLPLTLSWRNQDHIRKWFLNTDLITEENHFSWFERYNELDNDFVFLILAKEFGNKPFGQISLYKINWQLGSAEFGRLMIGNPSARGKGYARQAARLLLEFGFSHMGLNEIHLEVKVENRPAIALYKANGFVETNTNKGLVTMSIKDPIIHYRI